MRSGRFLLIGGAVLLAMGCGRSGTFSTENAIPLPHLPDGDDDDDAATPDVGDGHDGPFTIDGTMTVNTCAGITAASGSSISFGSPPPVDLGVGRRVIVMQVQVTGATSGDATPLSTGDAGRWEIARVAGVGGTSLSVETPLAGTYDTGAGRVAQACTIPEYTTVSCGGAPGSRLVARPWNGTSGGVLAFYASDSLDFIANDCQLTTQARGFRGGVVGLANAAAGVALDDTTLGAGGGKGEGLDSVSFTREGRGNYWNAGGGGNANESGGGGGSNGGAGGLGGTQDAATGANAATNGRGGAPVAFAELRLVMGGGGGAGQRDVAGEAAGAGGIGGGVALLFVRNLTATGTGAVINVSGTPGGDSTAAGAGGGGAGGTIVLRVVESAATAQVVIDASGGRGGNHLSSDFRRGSGGGGGGGVAWIDVPPGPLFVGTDGSAAGVNTGFLNDPYQAQPGAPGVRTGP